VYATYSLKPAIFLAGFSAGGQFVHGYAFMNPGYVKGVAVIAPGNAYPPPSETRHIPFLVMVGENDQAGSQAVAQQLATMLEQKGYSVELRVLEGTGHSISDQAVQRTLELYQLGVQGN
jgi:predicted esterase